MKNYLVVMIKGVLMGAANVIPGVSGGTVALLTGIFHPLLNALKSFDIKALRLLKDRKFKELIEHTQLYFLMAVGAGVFISILTLAKVLDYLFTHCALHVWSFFFGLIIASVFFVWKEIHRVNPTVILLFILGTAMAAGISFLSPASENSSMLYLFLCGIVAICAMILPGLSGSYVLLLMGNYQLIVIDAIVNLRFEILLPVAAGAAIGLLAFARFLSWIFGRFHDGTLSLLTGFIFGSLSTLWPWKTAIIKHFGSGESLKEKVVGYTYAWPALNTETAIALSVMIAGVLIMIVTEQMVARRNLTK